MHVSSDGGGCTHFFYVGRDGAIAPALIEVNDLATVTDWAKVVNQHRAERADECARRGQKGRISVKSCEIFFDRRK
jgi:hypothetical protein